MLLEAVADFVRSLPYFRGRAAILNTLTPTQGLKRATVFGLPMVLDLSELIQRNVFLGCYEPRETAVIRENLRPGSVFVDAGANVGWFTALAAGIVGTNGKVLSFEPSPYAYRLLLLTVARCPNVKAFNFGLSDHDGEAHLFVPPEANRNHNPSMVEYCPGAIPVTVRVRPLGAVLEELAVPRVDVMKIDVEAHEPEVFAGCESVLRRGCIRSILCEFHDPLLRKRGSSSFELLNYLCGLGYSAEEMPGMPAALEGKIVNVLLRFTDINALTTK
jgi:FkbM family methyltransferase